MSAPGKRFETPTRFVLVDDSLDSGWAHVHDTTLLDPCVASFAPAYRDRAEQMVESLNIHELAEQLRNTPGAPGFRRLELPTVTEKTQARINDAVTRAAGAVEYWTGQPPHGVPLRASSAAFPNTASGLLQPMPPEAAAGRLAHELWETAVREQHATPALDAAVEQAKAFESEHEPRPELFDEPEPGGSMPAFRPRGDEHVVKLSNGGRVHEFRHHNTVVRCRPCEWAAVAGSEEFARDAFEQHVESTLMLDAQLNRAQQVRPRVARNSMDPEDT